MPKYLTSGSAEWYLRSVSNEGKKAMLQRAESNVLRLAKRRFVLRGVKGVKGDIASLALRAGS